MTNVCILNPPCEITVLAVPETLARPKEGGE